MTDMFWYASTIASNAFTPCIEIRQIKNVNWYHPMVLQTHVHSFQRTLLQPSLMLDTFIILFNQPFICLTLHRYNLDSLGAPSMRIERLVHPYQEEQNEDHLTIIRCMRV